MRGRVTMFRGGDTKGMPRALSLRRKMYVAITATSSRSPQVSRLMGTSFSESFGGSFVGLSL